MRFQVPQFIGVEDKVFGPFTIKQFIYLAGGGGLSVIIYRFMGFWFGLIFIIPVAIFALALAFYKVNNKPFVNVLSSAFKFYIGDRFYIWKKTENKPTPKNEQKMISPDLSSMPKLSDSKLKELTWSLDINENVNR
jgi:hypothetical protein